ncbi:SDR family NAD(P)-dependent oxidoreductase [Amycolatopsis sp. NPDC051071]|uniref:SDR family NAD(P)-dependent oxidoreductase n=1 Tax=Amycolatopsis sp. NPDC051071 TaxID=3154637 RepID=UPI00343E3E14
MTRRERGEPIAIVGMACRYPDSDDPARLWETVVHGRRAFRRLPSERLALADYWSPDASAPDRTYSTQAAVLEGWQFDRDEFRVPGAVFRATDPAHWLALETAARVLTDADRPGGAGLDKHRVTVVVGNSLTGDVTRAHALRLRWPYVRDVLRATLPGVDDTVLDRVEARYLAAFPEVGDETLAGSLANTIAGRICNHFGFHGGGYTVDGACASSMLAVITSCRALTTGAADFALAGGVDLSLDPFELVGFAKTGALAAEDMRIYDERSAGFWPGEGCGMLALVRAEDAHAAGMPVYAEIRGWGVSSDGHGGITRPEVEGQLLALRRASEMAGIDHADVGLYEGHGTGTAVGDVVEMTALDRVRSGAPAVAALGSVKANIGHTKAAAGVAGVLKAALSLSSGLLPPTTGCMNPHPALGGTLRVLPSAEPWADTRRLAGVSAMGFGGINTHVVLGAATPPHRRSVARPVATRPSPETEVIAVSGHDLAEVAGELGKIAGAAARLSYSEVHDLACRYGRLPAVGPVRAALVVRTPDELATLAARAAAELPALLPRNLSTSPGLWLGNEVPGRVTLLFPGQGADRTGPVDTAQAQPALYRACRSALARLDDLGVDAAAAIGHSVGEIAALVWAGRLSDVDAQRLVAERGRIMAEYGATGTGMLAVAADAAKAQALCAGTGLVIAADNGSWARVLAGAVSELRVVAEMADAQGVTATWLPVSHGFHSPAMAACTEPWRTTLGHAKLTRTTLSSVDRNVVSTVYGRSLTASDDLTELLVTQLCAPVLFRDAVAAVTGETDLFCVTGPGRALAGLVAQDTRIPAVSMDSGASGDGVTAETAAALFAAGAVAELTPLFAGRAARPIDLDRERVFLANPCAVTAPVVPAPRPALDAVPVRDAATTITELLAEATELDAALIQPGARLLSDLNLSSLRATQFVVEAASALGRTPPSVSMAITDTSVGDLITEIERLPETTGPGVDTAVPGVRPWLGCFTETLVTASPGRWRPTDIVCLPDPEDVEALLDAGRKAIERKALVVASHGRDLAGFFRSLHHEHPDVGITLVQAPEGETDLSGLHAEPGRFRELVLGEDGGLTEPVERWFQVPEQASGLPLGAGDVLLVSGGGKGIGHACARALAMATGLSLAVVGRGHPESDPLLRANLDALRAEGIRVAYQPVDVADPEGVVTAVEKLTAETGPVTALMHASGVNTPARFTELRAEDFHRHLRPKLTGLRVLLEALPTESLRLLVTFGSVIGTHGMAGESHYALANGLLRAEARRWARRLPDCRVLNLDWTAWSGTGMAERMGAARALARAGATPIPVTDGTSLLLRLLAAPGTPVNVAVHGRLGQDTPSTDSGRFLRRIRVRHPDVEIVADATLSLRTDPWLDGHRVDGLALLPAVVGLEAMAQAASAVAGRALTVAEHVRFDRPIVVPDTGEHVVRVCALREGDTITAVLRGAEAGFDVDHFYAEFPLHPASAGPMPDPVPDHGRIEPAELYDRLLFHGGHFRRVVDVAVPDPWSCRATIAAGEPWFPSVLGDSAAHDATIHVLQACVPARRLLPIGCDRVEMSPRPRGAWRLRGAERHAENGRYTWDVTAEDAEGQLAVRWTGLRLADSGPLPADRPWPVSLVPVLITRTAAALGLDRSLRVSIGEPFTVDTTGTCPTAGAWEPVGTRSATPDAELLRVIEGPCADPRETLTARVSAISRCLAQRKITPSTVRFSGVYDGGWLVLHAGDARIASVVLPVAGFSRPIAIAVLTAGGTS